MGKGAPGLQGRQKRGEVFEESFAVRGSVLCHLRETSWPDLGLEVSYSCL